MTREEARRENARSLAKQVGGPTAFAKILQMEGSQVSQIIGKTPKKNIGNSIARRIEVAFSKPEGWLDVLQQREEGISKPGAAGKSTHLAVVGDEEVEGHAEATSRPNAPGRAPLTVEQLLSIEAITDAEATLLRKYRAASEDGRKDIEIIADSAEREGLSIIHNESQS